MPIPRDRPIESEEALLSLYHSIDVEPTDDPVYRLIDNLANEFKSDNNPQGLSILISGTWGVGKTSYVNVLVDKISQGNLIINARSMFYGNFDEYIQGIFSEFYQKVYERFGLKLKELITLEKHATVSIEGGVNFGFLSLKINRSQNFKFSKNISSDQLLERNSQLNQKLLNIFPHRTIIIIDDIDRLKPEELMTALRLIEVLKQLNSVTVIAISDMSQLGAILHADKVPNAYKFSRKVFDRTTHLQRSPEEIKNLIHNMVSNTLGPLNNTLKQNISDAFYFLILTQVFRNISELWDEVNEASPDPHIALRRFWNILNMNSDRRLGPIFKALRTEFGVAGGSNYSWIVRDKKIKRKDFNSDPLGCLSLNDLEIDPFSVRDIWQKDYDSHYWTEMIITRPNSADKKVQYKPSKEMDADKMCSTINGGDELPSEYLGTVEANSRWHIARNILNNPNKNNLNTDFSLAQLNDLRLMRKFSDAVASRIEKLAAETDDNKKIKVYLECVERFEEQIKLEGGEL